MTIDTAILAAVRAGHSKKRDIARACPVVLMTEFDAAIARLIFSGAIRRVSRHKYAVAADAP